MNLFGGTLLFGETNFLRWESSLSSLCGLFRGSCSCECSRFSWESTAAIMVGFSELGLRILSFSKWVLIGKGEKEEEKERSWVR